MVPFVPVLVEHHAHREARPILAHMQRTKIGRQNLRQHRHHAVGEIGRVTAIVSLAVERRARRHIMRHIGNGDDGDMPARVLRIVIRPGPHRIVMIARIFGIDGDKRNGAQIFAPACIDWFGGSRFRKRIRRKFRGNAVRVNGDQADRLGRIQIAQPLDNARARQSGGAPRKRFGQHQLVRARATAIVWRDHEFELRLAVDGNDAPFFRAVAINAQHLVHARTQPLDDARFVTILHLGKAREHALALARCIAFAARHHDDVRWRAFVFPFLRAGEKFAVIVLSGDFQHQHIGHRTGLGEGAFAAAFDFAVLFQFPQDAFQGDAIAAMYAQNAREIALGCLGFTRQRREHTFLGDRRAWRVVRFFVQFSSFNWKYQYTNPVIARECGLPR